VKTKKISFIFFKGLLAIGVCGYLFTILDISQLKTALAKTDFNYLAAGILIVLITRILYAWQTMLALKHHGIPLTTTRALVINTISGFYNLFLPGTLSGGIVKWYKLSKPSGKRAEVFSAVFFLRFINTIFILLLGLVGFIMDNPVGSSFLVWVAVFLCGGLFAFYICFFSKRFIVFMEAILNYIQLRIPSLLRDGLHKILVSLTRYRSLSFEEVFKILLVPIINQFFTILLLIAIAAAIDLQIPVHVLFWLWSMIYIIQIIPASISGLGLREGALVYLLPFYGVDPAKAMLFSLAIFSFTILAGLIGGILEAKEFLL
jgi:uncharacterized protein (TIRG00374 family)